jgi:hypothetical protein
MPQCVNFLSIQKKISGEELRNALLNIICGFYAVAGRFLKYGL